MTPYVTPSPKKVKNITNHNKINIIHNDGVTPYVTPLPKKYNKIQNPKKIYRGRGPKNRQNSTFAIMISNLCGYKSKKKIT